MPSLNFFFPKSRRSEKDLDRKILERVKGESQKEIAEKTQALQAKVQELSETQEALLSIMEDMTKEEELVSLYESLQKITSERSFKELTNLIPSSLAEKFGFDQVILFTSSGVELSPAGFYLKEKGAWEKIQALSFPVTGEDFLSKTIYQRKINILEKPGETLSKSPQNDKKLFELLKPSYLSLIPLVLPNLTLGVLWAGFTEKGKLEKGQLRLLEVFTASSALALGNARLYAETLEEAGKTNAILEQTGEGMVGIDLNHNIFLYNDAAEEIFGIPEVRVLSRKEHDVLTILDKEGNPLGGKGKCLLIPIQKEGGFSDEVRIVNLKGGDVPAHLSARFIRDEGGKPLGVILTVRDIAKEKELEQTRKEFVFVASHELKAPVTAVEGNLSLILDNPQRVGSLDAETAEILYDIRVANRRLLDLVKDLLDVSRIETGTIKVEPQPVNLTPIIFSAVGDLKPLSEEKGLKVTTPQRGVLVLADPQRIEEVVSNLVSNAIKFNKEQGSVDIKVGEEKDRVIVSVSDTGMGMTPKDLANLFKRFWRSESAKDIEGTGLGLFITKELVAKMGGKIWVDSTYGKGTTFYVSLPKAK